MKNLSFFLLLCCSMCLVSPLNAQNLLGKSGAKAWDSMLQKVMPSCFKNTLLLHTHRPTAVTLPRPFTGAKSAYGALAFSRAMLKETTATKPLVAAPQLHPFEQYAKHFVCFVIINISSNRIICFGFTVNAVQNTTIGYTIL